MKFTKQQQYIIAEFIFAHETDTLIKPEAQALIEVFQEHSVPEAYVANLSIEDCVDLLVKNTTSEERSTIMADYYSGNLP
jgi:hypothetical protein